MRLGRYRFAPPWWGWVIVCLGVAALSSLGVWQIERGESKQAMLAQRQAAGKSPARDFLEVERGLNGAVSDTAITAQIWQKFLAQDEKLFLDIEIEVVEGEVLLAGQVPTVSDQLEAVRLSWQVNGVKSVHNEIEIGEGMTLVDNASDLLITTKIKTALMFDGDVFAINYSVETVNGTVHLMGIAQDELERNRVISHARDTSYVKRVVSHIRLKDDAIRQGT